MCRVGLWGTFDLEDFGLLLHPRIFRHELARRLPGADIRIFAPYGYQRPIRWDGGEPAEPLSAAVAADLDCVVVDASLLRTDDELAGDYGVDVADLPARPLPAGSITAPADYALLAPRVFPAAVLARRLEYLRLMGWYPRQGEAVVVEGGSAPPTDARFAGRHVVVAQLAPYRGEGEVAGATYRMPAAVSHEDVVAAISASAAFLGTSPQARLVDEAYRDPDGVRSRQAALDRHFDTVAEAALAAAAGRANGQVRAGTGPDPAYLAALRRAHDLRGQRLLAERVVFADRVADLERALDVAHATARTAQQQAADDATGRQVAEADLAALRATRTFRWSHKPRAAYEWFRQLRSGP